MRVLLLGVTIVAISIVALPLFAQHSSDAQFDASRPLTLAGEITGVDWITPHSYLWISVKERNGEIRHWHVEGGPSNFLTQSGWTKDLLAMLIKSHATVTASGFESKVAPSTDGGIPLSITGIVTQLDWINPFSFLYVEAKAPTTNATTNYCFALGHLSDLAANGWARDTVKAGVNVTLTGLMMKDNLSRGNALTITLPDGKVLKAAADYMLPPGRERSPNAWIKEIELPDGRKLLFSKDPY